MKRILFSFLICVSSLSFAGNYALEVGISNTTVSPSDTSDELVRDYNLGYRFGIVAKYNLNDYFDFESGFLYSARNYGMTGFSTVTGQQYKYDANFSYLDVPLLIHLKLTDWLSVYAGAIVGFNVVKRAKGSIDGFSLDINYPDTTSPLAFGHGGIHFNLDSWGIDLYYEKGFGEIYQNGEKDFSIVGVNLLFWFDRADDNYDYRRSSQSSRRSRND